MPPYLSDLSPSSPTLKDFSKETDARIVIDDLLRQAGWDPADKSMVLMEIRTLKGAGLAAERSGLQGASITTDGDEIPTGRADYVLLAKNGRPLAIIEAKRSAI